MPRGATVFQIEISRTHLRVCLTGNSAGQTYTYRGESGFCWIDADLPTPLSSGVWNDQAVFMITHVAYNPENSCFVRGRSVFDRPQRDRGRELSA
jgi:hypothetical protein